MDLFKVMGKALSGKLSCPWTGVDCHHRGITFLEHQHLGSMKCSSLAQLTALV